MSETQTSDFIRALNSMMYNLENVAEKLLAMSEKIEKLESSVKSFRIETARNEKGRNTEERKQLTNDATISAETPHEEPSETQSETETTTNGGTDLRQSENETQELVHAKMRDSGTSKKNILAGAFSKIIRNISAKSNYYILAVALAIFGIIIAKLSFILFT
jgi:chromosome segregation ATPase